MIRILIVDDHLLIREGFKRVVSNEIDMKAVGECKNAAEALSFLKNNDCDVIVLDLNMPGKNGLDLLKELPLRQTGIRVLVLSMQPEEHFAIRALQSGASGYLNKESAADDLVEAIRKVYHGGKYVSNALAEQLVEYVQRDPSEILHQCLSDREFQVLRLIGAGKTNTEITDELMLSASSVRTYRQRILQKLGLKSTSELIHYALKHDLID